MDIKKELQDLCDRYKAEAEAILNKAKAEKKAWKPEADEEYWAINGNGSVEIMAFNSDWDENAYSIGNCFPTKEAAEFAVEKLKVIAELKRFAEEHNKPMDWKDSEEKYHLYYDFSESIIECFLTYSIKDNNIYFSSEEIAKAAIEAIGEERLKKYYFEVEE